MKLSILVLLAMSLAVALVVANPAIEEDAEDEQTEISADENNDDQAIERERRSSLMAQILYEELRHKLKGDLMRSSYPTRRVASASVMRKRRSTTPLGSKTAHLFSEGGRTGNLGEQSEIDDIQEEIDTISRRLMKRSLMAMILKDTLKQRLEEENKPGRHRDIVWGKSTRSYGPARKQSAPTHVIELSPQLTETLSEVAELEEQQPALSSSEVLPVAYVIRPKVGKA